MKFLSVVCGLLSVLSSSANLFETLKQSLPSFYHTEDVTDPMAFQALSIASFSYCDISQIENRSCEDCLNRELIFTYQPPKKESSQVVIMADHHDKQLLIGIRGDRSAKAWMTNVPDTSVRWIVGEIQADFHRKFNEFVFPTLLALKEARKQYPYYPIIIGGHSTGGVLAALLGSFLTHKYPRMTPSRLYTFGSPRPGNELFAHDMQIKFFDRYMRFINQDDIMGDIPPRSMKYYHTGKMVQCLTGTIHCIYGMIRDDHEKGIVYSILDALREEDEMHWVYLGKRIKDYQCTE